MFNAGTLNLTKAQLISWTVDNRALVNDPGTTYSYSNFGYCVLGRVIEMLTGQSYFDFVNSEVLSPAGITAMKIAGNTEVADVNAASEVKDYPKACAYANYMLVDRMDAHGGCIAAPVRSRPPSRECGWLQHQVGHPLGRNHREHDRGRGGWIGLRQGMGGEQR